MFEYNTLTLEYNDQSLRNLKQISVEVVYRNAHSTKRTAVFIKNNCEVTYSFSE